MKIVHVSEAFGGGIIDFIFHLTSELKNHQHTIIYTNRFESIGYIKERFDENVRFIEWNQAQREINLFNDITAAYYLYRFLKNIDYDVIHLHSSKAGFLGRIVGLFLKNKKIIYTPNGAPFARIDIPNYKRKLYILLEKLAAKLSGEVVCVSISEADAYNTNGIKCTYINNGIKIKPHQIIGKKTNTLRIITVGRILAQKNPVMFNDIAKSFLSVKSVEFLWVGDGELKNLLTSENIEITGWLDRETVTEKIKGSDLYLSTALWEGLPFAVLETMNLGKPLLLRKCIGNVDLINDNTNGFLFDTVNDAIDKINYFIENTNDLNIFGLRSYEYCEKNFDVQEMANKYQDKYLSL